jgi:hypothetical protein
MAQPSSGLALSLLTVNANGIFFSGVNRYRLEGRDNRLGTRPSGNHRETAEERESLQPGNTPDQDRDKDSPEPISVGCRRLDTQGQGPLGGEGNRQH